MMKTRLNYIRQDSLAIPNAAAETGYFAGKMENYSSSLSKGYSRRNFYKISLLVKGEGTLYYTDQEVLIKGYTLIFTNPMIPYAYESHAMESEQGYFCLFTEEFINGQLREGQLANSPLFKVGGTHSLPLDEKTAIFISNVFERLTDEAQSQECKPDLLRAYMQLIIHEALKMEPQQKSGAANTSKLRLTDLFLKLLDVQFMQNAPNRGPDFFNAQQYALQLSTHPNHLNRVLKAATGKSTTQHISERMLSEAKSRLLHGNQNIAELAYSLGFGHASNFQAFFKRHTGQSANTFRKQHAANS